MFLPTITEAADLLALLDEDPRRRAITYEPLAEAADRPRVYAYPGARIEATGRALDVIGEAGSADALLNAAIEVDVREDLEAYAASPIRFLPGKDDAAWVHPDHAEAPAAPCINGEPGTVSNSDNRPERASLPTITEADDLMLMLRDDPRRRVVTYGWYRDHVPTRPCVCEYPDARIEGIGRILAVIERGSADDLLHAAIDADVREDLEAWAACPIRCHPRTWETIWIHPDHPEARNAPCLNGRPGR
jgi:hypothetical protein